jgi:hypothetical protein
MLASVLCRPLEDIFQDKSTELSTDIVDIRLSQTDLRSGSVWMPRLVASTKLAKMAILLQVYPGKAREWVEAEMGAAGSKMGAWAKGSQQFIH